MGAPPTSGAWIWGTGSGARFILLTTFWLGFALHEFKFHAGAAGLAGRKFFAAHEAIFVRSAVRAVNHAIDSAARDCVAWLIAGLACFSSHISPPNTHLTRSSCSTLDNYVFKITVL